MSPEVTSIADYLRETGPYGLVAALGWAFWKISEKKDAAIRDLYEQVADLGRIQTAAITKMEAALVGLKEAVTELLEPTRGRNADAAQ
ncbi:MAG: hypothetical protein AB7K71_36595 [Polyangiaceae bacterium]